MHLALPQRRLPQSALVSGGHGQAPRSARDLFQFAQPLSISKRTLQEWEQGRRSPSGAAQALIRIARKHPEVVGEALA